MSETLKVAKVLSQNGQLISTLTSQDGQIRKQAVDAANEYIRRGLREDGFTRKGILPPDDIGPEDLDPNLEDDTPMRIFELEPNSPGAVSVPFDTFPPQFYMGMRKFKVRLNRITSRNHTIDVARAMTYRSPIRDIFADLALKELLTIEDSQFIRAVNTILGDVGVDTILGVPQFLETANQLTRDELVNATKVMISTNRHLVPKMMLMSHATSLEMAKWGRDEVGGNTSEDILLRGFRQTSLLDTDITVTIKNDIIPDDNIYFFAEPKFLGKHLMLNDATLHTETEAFIVRFFLWMTSGFAIANPGAVARYRFNSGG